MSAARMLDTTTRPRDEDDARGPQVKGALVPLGPCGKTCDTATAGDGFGCDRVGTFPLGVCSGRARRSVATTCAVDAYPAICGSGMLCGRRTLMPAPYASA